MTQSNQPICRIAILGGGITGLAAAHELARARQTGAPIDEFLLEAGERLGGLIQTEDVEGFTIEAGPDSFLTAKRGASDLCSELGLAASLTGSNDGSRRTLILHRGRLEPLPDGLMFFVPTRLVPALGSRLISFESKFAILRDALRRRPPVPRNSDADESVASLVRRHLGNGVLEAIVDPLMAGVYGGDTEQLSARVLLPRFVAMEREWGSLVRGMLGAQKTASPAEPLFTTLKRGMAELPRALAARLEEVSGSADPRVFLSQSVESVEPVAASSRPEAATGSRPFRYAIRCRGGRSYEADAIVFALPATECARLLAPVSAPASRALAAIPYTPAVVVALGYPRLPKGLPESFGFLVPPKEGRKLLACTFVHAKFANRAPAGSALLRCFLGGAHQPDAAMWSDEELVSVVDRELREILGIAHQPAFRRIYRWPAAMPQYLVGHEKRIAEIERSLSGHPGLFLAGNAYGGIGIPDCIGSGRRAARRACEFAASK
ncbi:MAG: protoporphyrinogen oxidase [Terriglobia bacterium]